jgi:membrane protein implicated in regulation of membrane protease activity
MEWSLTHFWLILALILGLAELTSGVMVLLALGIAAAMTAVLAFAGGSFEWQLASMGVLSGVLVPVAILWLKPQFSPQGVAYGTTGTGVEHGTVYQIIKMNGDFYRVRISDTGEMELPEGTRVIFKTFDGTTAVVVVDHQKEC